MFFKHFASKNQLPGFYIKRTLVENGLNAAAFKSKPIKIEDTKVRSKTRSQQYKTSKNSYSSIIQKLQTYHQQNHSQYQQLAGQHLPRLQSPS